MRQKIVKTRKIHLCEVCGEEIDIGKYAIHYEDRQPVFNNERNFQEYHTQIQTGIEYVSWYYHTNCKAHNTKLPQCFSWSGCYKNQGSS